jgi:hypothetical protein
MAGCFGAALSDSIQIFTNGKHNVASHRVKRYVDNAARDCRVGDASRRDPREFTTRDESEIDRQERRFGSAVSQKHKCAPRS